MSKSRSRKSTPKGTTSPYFSTDGQSPSRPKPSRKKRLKDNPATPLMESPEKIEIRDDSGDECIGQGTLDPDMPHTPPPLKQDSEQLRRLRAIEQVEQRSEAWYLLRKSMITASDWASVLGEGKSRKKEDVILKKCGQGEKFTGNVFTDWGTKYEPVATRMYELRNQTKVYEFGCLRHPKYPFLGASPDGITPEGVMLEIKCPYSRKITGIVPRYYWIQVQGQLEVCDLSLCDFLECKIEEYPNMKMYLEDVEENPPTRVYNVDKRLQKKFEKGDVFIRSEDGMEKGAVITYITKDGSKQYAYSELGVSEKEFKRWYKSTKKKVDPSWTEMRITFWRLNHFSCVRVQRDNRWFSEALVKLTQAWNEIEHYRNIGCESLLVGKKNQPAELEEPSSQDIHAAVQQDDGLIDLIDHALIDEAYASLDSFNVAAKPKAKPKAKVSPSRRQSVVSTTSVVSMVEERKTTETKVPVTAPEPPSEKEMEKLEGELDEFEEVFGEEEVLLPPMKCLPVMVLDALADLEIASWFLPQFIPIAVEEGEEDERSLVEFQVSLTGLSKVVSRAKTALVRLLKSKEDLGELAKKTSLEKLLRRTNVWMRGIPNLLQDVVDNLEMSLDDDLKDLVVHTMETANKWVDTLYDKIQLRLDSSLSLDSDSSEKGEDEERPDEVQVSEEPQEIQEVQEEVELTPEEEAQKRRERSLQETLKKLDKFKYRGPTKF